MPYNRPGPGVYVENGSNEILHGTPVYNSNFVGVAVKQKTESWDAGLTRDPDGKPAGIIHPDEPYFIITKGIVQVLATGLDPAYDLTGAGKGDEVWISQDGTLDTSGDAPFGRIVELPGERGTPPDRVRIDLDAKDSVAAAAAAPGGGA